MKIALVYDRVNKWGGAERVLLTLHELFPKAPLYTSVYDPIGAPWAKVFPEVVTSYLQKLPLANKNHEILAPLMPSAFEQFDFNKYDLVISVTSEAAKGVRTNSNTKHINYILTPTRYLWSGYGEYFNNPLTKAISYPIVHKLRNLDIKASQNPDKIISISTEVKKRVKKYYKRYSEVVYPPVELPNTKLSYKSKENFYLIVSRFVPYKKVDLAIQTFNRLGKQLIIVGSGRQERYLKRIANRNIYFTGQVSDQALNEIYHEAKALIFPQFEDFGIVAVEAQARGTPVIAYKAGGALDTVINEKTGLFFEKQTVESLSSAIVDFEKRDFHTREIIRNAKRFSKERFKKEFMKQITI